MTRARTDMHVFAADIGGTHARLALAHRDGGRIVLDHQRILEVRAHASLAAALEAFLGEVGGPAARAGCIAWAGPIEQRRARLTNGAWTADADAMAERFGLAQLALVNDFHAAAAGVEALEASDLVPLQTGSADAAGNRLVIGAGTGLGVAYVLRDADGARVLAGEGGHAAFAPLDDEQAALWQQLHRDLGRVTAEHVLSGRGIVRLYRFCCAAAGVEANAAVDQDGAAAVQQLADAGDARAARALTLFCSIFGAVAGDHALSCMATGGVFVAGGIAARLAARMADGTFTASFRAKGRHADVVARMPVWLVRDELLGVKGAALIADRLARAAQAR